MTKKREKFLIDLMDDTDSDNSGSIKPKAWKRLRKGNARHEANAEVCFDDNFVDDEDPTRVNWDPFAFGSMFWCGDNPDADELRWQARQKFGKKNWMKGQYYISKKKRKF